MQVLMKEKEYVKPTAEVVEMQAEELICASINQHKIYDDSDAVDNDALW